MGDRERDKGKQKRPEYEGYGESSQVSARRTRARMTSGPGGQNGVSVNPSLPPLDLRLRDDRSRIWQWQRSQQQPAGQGGGEEGGSGGLQTLDLISQIDRPLHLSDPEVMGSFPAPSSAAQHQESDGVGNPGTLMPPPCAGTPSSSSQMNFARDSTRQRSYTTEVQPAANMAPQAQSSSQALRSRRRRRSRAPVSYHLAQDLSMPSSDAQRGDTSRDGGRDLQVQHAAAKGASGSGQPQPRANAGAVIQCSECYNNPRGDQCQLCGGGAREPVPVNLAIDPHQRQPTPPPQQGLPVVPTNNNTLVPQPPAPVLEGQAQPSAGAEYWRCPGCRNRPRLIVTYPLLHLCLCAFCRVSLGCSLCGYATPSPGTQG